MKKNELKTVLKPLIKECIKEVIFEEGVLSSLISEVMKGTSSVQLREESVPAVVQESANIEARAQLEKKAKAKLQETRKKMLDAIGHNSMNGVNVFEGTEPLRKAGNPGGAATPSSPLDTYAPNDAGVDISSLFSSKWKQMV